MSLIQEAIALYRWHDLAHGGRSLIPGYEFDARAHM